MADEKSGVVDRAKRALAAARRRSRLLDHAMNTLTHYGNVQGGVFNVVTKQGGEVRGIRVNEDALTIQVRDQAGKFYSLRKADLELLEKQAGKSLMPSFASRIKADELTDLVAYVSSLRSE